MRGGELEVVNVGEHNVKFKLKNEKKNKKYIIYKCTCILYLCTIPLSISSHYLFHPFIYFIPLFISSHYLFHDPSGTNILYFSQKQLPREMKSRLVIIKCAGYVF